MDGLEYDLLSKWLLLFGENVAVAIVVVAVFAAVGPWIERRNRWLMSNFHGVVFGLSAIISTTYPVTFAPGVFLDMRNVFVLMGSLAGGPVAAAIAVCLTVAYRIYIGGAGTIVGIGAVLIAAGGGLLVVRRYGPRVRELGVLHLMAIGLGVAVATHIWGRSLSLLKGLPPLPIEAVVATLILYPMATALLGLTINSIRYSVWRQSQRESAAELERRDRELRISQDHLALAQRVAHIGSIEVDIPSIKAVWSDEIYRLFGLAPGRTSFEYFLSAIHPDDRPGMMEDHKLLARGEALPPREYRVIHPDGQVRWLYRHVELLRDATGAPARHISTFVDITDRKQIEAALRTGEAALLSSREHLARAQAIAHIGSAEIDLAGGIGADRWSDELYRILGIEPGSIPSSFDNFIPFVHPDDREKMLTIRAATEAGKAPEPCEYRIIRPDGEIRWLYRQSDKLYDARGQAIKAVVSLQDITERRRFDFELAQRETELQRSREHLAQAQRVGMVGSAEFDLVGGKHTWSDELFRLFGLQPGAVAPGFKQFLDLVHPEDRGVMLDIQDATRQGRGVPAAEFRVLRSDGEVRWLQRQSGVVTGESGKTTTIIVSFHDITDGKRAGMALHDREEQLRLNQDHLVIAQKIGRIGSAELDLENRVTFWSDEHYRLLGIEPHEMPPTSETLLSFIHPDDRSVMKGTFVGAREGLPAVPLEYRIVRRDGELRWIRRVQDILYDATGKPTKLIATHQDITERKASEEALREREAQLVASQDHLALAQRVGKIGSAEFDFATSTTRWSEQLFEILGLDPAKTTPSFEALLAVLPLEDHELARRLRAQELNRIASPAREWHIIRPDGERRWVLRQAEMVMGEGGKASKNISTFQDITDRRRMEEELQVSREHLARAQRIGRIGSAEVDLQTKRAYWSDGMFDLLGLERSKATIGGDTFMNAVHPDDRELVAQHRTIALRGATTMPLEFRIVRPDGSTRWIYHKVEMVLGADGRPHKLIGIDQDITDLKQAMQELGERDVQYRDSQKHLALAQRVGRIGSVEFNRTTNASQWSDEMFALFGLDPATAQTGEATFLSVIHPDDREVMRRRRDNLVRGESNTVNEFRILRADTGEMRWIQSQSGPIADPDSPNIAVATFQDITELKLAQNQREEVERQLMQAQKMEAVGNLTGGIAHDFNNLLNVILGRLDLIESELSDRPLLREWVQICSAAARKGASLTRNMMAFARQQPLRPTAIDLTESIREMVRILQRSLGDAIEIKVVVEDGLWICEADPAQLQSALLNLALNARDAMPDGGKLTIDAHNGRLDANYAARNADVKPGDYVILAVTDTGTGMPANVIERAFEPFFTTKEVGKGSGLGLSMVYGFARQSGGHVKIYSEMDHGTTIRLYLPRSTKVETEAEPEAALTVETPHAEIPPLVNGHETILVVEDDDDMRDLSAAVLERLGYVVLSARDAESAIPVFAAHPEIALLLTDISLPGSMNGRKLADQLTGLRPTLKVLYMSGYSEDAVIHQGRLDPGVRLLQKPFQNEDLAFQIRAALSDG
ncbi:MAG TPA: PAS domain-containing protein [Magnetospirillaceae bacterium]|jgi:PAS domain S-box-containing protein